MLLSAAMISYPWHQPASRLTTRLPLLFSQTDFLPCAIHIQPLLLIYTLFFTYDKHFQVSPTPVFSSKCALDTC